MTTAQAFALKICLSLSAGFWLMVWSNPQKWREMLDIYLGTTLGAILGARTIYVLLNWERFWETPANIPRLWYGELAWQGIFLGGGMAFWGLLRWRKSHFAEIADHFAWAMPLALIGICWAARSAGLLLGETVADLKDHPVWMAGFLPALDRDVQARYELQMLGVGMGTAILGLLGVLSFKNWLAEVRFWVALALIGLAILLLDQFSAHPRQHIYDVRIDQFSASFIFLLGIGMGTLNASVKRRADTLLDSHANGL